MNTADIEQLDWRKGDGLLPAVVQDSSSGQVLMLGFMNAEALRQTLVTRQVTFFSRTKNRLWTKGETSGNVLDVVAIAPDCDRDSLLIIATPHGPTCHNGTQSCFGDQVRSETTPLAFLDQLESVLAQRVTDRPEGSYTARLWAEGTTRIAQKVGEEGVEVALAAATQADDRLVSESADLLYHLTLLLKNRGLSLATVVGELEKRHRARS